MDEWQFAGSYELAFPPETWVVRLSDGGELQVLTHGFENS